MPTQLRQLLLVCLMVFTLAGVQLVQSSPLHDHARHSVDCGLCHLQLSDDALAQSSHMLAFIAAELRYTLYFFRFYSVNNPSPYQGRAPPPLFSSL